MTRPSPDSIATAPETSALLRTPLHAAHLAAGARMAPFAGYDMPIQYADGIIAEHEWTRTNASVFDVSHMGQALLAGAGAARLLEGLVPADIVGLEPGRTRYTQFLTPHGGILDDLMATRLAPGPGGEDRIALIVNAARKQADFAHLRASLPDIRLTVFEDRALIALQGPAAAAVLERRWPIVGAQPFMSQSMPDGPEGAWVWRSGYTGEDGFEISLPAQGAPDMLAWLCAQPQVRLAGLGARDSLRLEAGLCLYGHDIDESTSPVEAGLAWSIQKRRRIEGGFPGAERVLRELQHGPARRRVGLALSGRQPAREGAVIETVDGAEAGRVTSGGYSPGLGHAIAMGYVATAFAAPGAELAVVVRNRRLPALVTRMPFVPTRYFKS